MLIFYVYIIKCADDSYYIGQTDNLEKRIAEHKIGACAGYSSTRLPIELVYSQEFASRDEAIAAERKIKKWNRKKKEALIQGDFEALRKYSKPGVTE